MELSDNSGRMCRPGARGAEVNLVNPIVSHDKRDTKKLINMPNLTLD
jgi:hypothetical protein